MAQARTPTAPGLLRLTTDELLEVARAAGDVGALTRLAQTCSGLRYPALLAMQAMLQMKNKQMGQFLDDVRESRTSDIVRVAACCFLRPPTPLAPPPLEQGVLCHAAITNIMGVSHLEMAPDPITTFISGRRGTGKSALLRGISFALDPRAASRPYVLRNGCSTGRVELWVSLRAPYTGRAQLVQLVCELATTSSPSCSDDEDDEDNEDDGSSNEAHDSTGRIRVRRTLNGRVLPPSAVAYLRARLGVHDFFRVPCPYMKGHHTQPREGTQSKSGEEQHEELRLLAGLAPSAGIAAAQERGAHIAEVFRWLMQSTPQEMELRGATLAIASAYLVEPAHATRSTGVLQLDAPASLVVTDPPVTSRRGQERSLVLLAVMLASCPPSARFVMLEMPAFLHGPCWAASWRMLRNFAKEFKCQMLVTGCYPADKHTYSSAMLNLYLGWDCHRGIMTLQAQGP